MRTQELKKVYLISGLGADSRSFGFLDLSFCDPHFVNWIKPFPNEKLEYYAERLFHSIRDEDAVIAGVSFGGMLATEIAKKHPGTKVIILSSAKTIWEIPAYLRFWKHFPIYRYHFASFKNYTGKAVLSILGARGLRQKKIQQQILQDSDPAFTLWAIDAILHWTNTCIPNNLIHIHGTADKLLPYRYVKADYAVKGGEHLLIMDRAAEVSQLLERLIV